MNIDVETTAEAIQEDEELIEAVEELVEAAAVSLYTDIVDQIHDIVTKWRNLVETMFPFLVYWRQDEALFWDDLQKLGLSAALFLLAFCLMAPSNREGGKGRKKRWLGRFRRSSSFSSIQLKYLQPHEESYSPTDPNRGKERRHSTSDLSSQGGVGASATLCTGRIVEDDIETEEEIFEKMWPTIAESDYCRLVLPPRCKLVEKPRRAKREESKSKKSHRRQEHKEDDEDHPLKRIRNYTRQFAHLLMKLLRYDYVGAGWTLIDWFQSCLRIRQNRENHLPDDEEEDDESDAGSLASRKRTSVTSLTSANATSASLNHAPISPQSPKRRPRAKYDVISSSPKTNSIRRDTRRDVEVRCNHHDGASSSNDSRDGGPAARLSPLTVDMSSTSTLLSCPGSHDDEEKKESPLDLDGAGFMPSLTTPHHTGRPREGSFESGETELGERGAARLSSHRRSSNVKTRDALEPYRQNPLRLGGAGKAPPPPPYPPPPKSPSGRPYHQQLPGRIAVSQPDLLAREPNNYFESINSQESLRKLAVEVPVPDRNGYIVGDDFLPDNTYTPLLVFVNSRSGPQQGHLLITQLRRLLNPIQVWDLADGGPEAILESFTSMTRLRILVCGGDGTVSWIVSTIEKMGLQRWPPIAILPLGTGNDLARIHGWGGGYNNESLIGILQQVAESYISWLDRWEMTVVNKKGKVKSIKSFFNYLGVGADAQAALQVHMLRESRPQLFFSRVVNKAWYGIFGAEDIIKATSVNLPNNITLIADGVEVPLPADSQGIILLNIDSYAGGVPLWSLGTKGDMDGRPVGAKRDGFRRSRSLDELRKKRGRSYSLDRVDSVEDIASLALPEEEKYRRVTACERPSSCQDGLLDIVSVRGAFHLGQIRVGLSNAQLLCQCREATIHIKRKIPVQIDGEPWRQNTCTLQVKRKKDAAIMLHRSADDSNGVETEMAKLLDWAEEKSLIDDQVHAALMKEFSRRIESKTRQRRVRSQDNIMFSLKRAIGSSGNFQSAGSANNIMF